MRKRFGMLTVFILLCVFTGLAQLIARLTLNSPTSPMTDIVRASDEIADRTITSGEWLLSDTPWPTLGHDFQRTGRSPFIGVTGTHAVATWTSPVPQLRTISTGLSNTLFLKTNGRTDILDLQTHQVIGDLPGGSCRSLPTQMANGNIYYGADFTMYAYQGFHHLLWTFQHSGGCRQIAAILDPGGTVYFPTGSIGGSLLIAADASNGEIQWTFPLSLHGPGGLALGHNGTIYANTPSELFAINPDGTMQWQTLAGRSTVAPSIGDDGTIYSVSDDALAAINVDGTLQWEFPIYGDVCSYNALAVGLDGTIYVPTTKPSSAQGDDLAYFYAVNPDGSLKWQHVEVVPQGHAGFCNSPVVDRNNNSYICDDKGFCYGFNPEGNLMWSYFVEANSSIRAQPVISDDGVMYIPAVLSLVRIEGINLNRATHLPLVQNAPSGD